MNNLSSLTFLFSFLLLGEGKKRFVYIYVVVPGRNVMWIFFYIRGVQRLLDGGGTDYPPVAFFV